MKYLRAIGKYWPLLLSLGMAVLALVEARRADHAVSALTRYQAEIQIQQSERATAAARDLARGSGQVVSAVSDYADREVSNASIVDRVTARVARQCVRDDSAAPAMRAATDPTATVPAGVPDADAGAGAGAGAGAQAQGEPTDSAYASAVAADLRGCASELNRLQLCLDYVHALPSEPTP